MGWTAIGTIALAIATIALAIVTFFFVLESRRQTRELREARFADVLPMLRWQEPSAALTDDDQFIFKVCVFLTNEGVGPARVLAADATSSVRGERVDIWDFHIPSTLQPAERIQIKVLSQAAEERRLGLRILKIRIRYGDLLGEFQYETTPTIDVDVRVEKTGSLETPASGSEATFRDSDERSALARRLSPSKNHAHRLQ